LRRTAGPYMWASSGRLQRTRVWERDEARMLRLANEAHRGVPNDHKFIANPPEVGIEIIADVRRHQPAAHAVSISWNAPRFPATVGHTRLREMQKLRMRHLSSRSDRNAPSCRPLFVSPKRLPALSPPVAARLVLTAPLSLRRRPLGGFLDQALVEPLEQAGAADVAVGPRDVSGVRDCCRCTARTAGSESRGRGM
jgi:hypothetical protein